MAGPLTHRKGVGRTAAVVSMKGDLFPDMYSRVVRARDYGNRVTAQNPTASNIGPWRHPVSEAMAYSSFTRWRHHPVTLGISLILDLLEAPRSNDDSRNLANRHNVYLVHNKRL